MPYRDDYADPYYRSGPPDALTSSYPALWYVLASYGLLGIAALVVSCTVAVPMPCINVINAYVCPH